MIDQAHPYKPQRHTDGAVIRYAQRYGHEGIYWIPTISNGARMIYVPHIGFEWKEDPYFCGDIEPHEKHDDEGTPFAKYFVSTCVGIE